jgi:TonB family protein
MSSSGHMDPRRAPAAQAPLRTTAIRRAPVIPSAAAAPKVLRIGVIQGGKIMEEQIVRQRESVTIGQSEKNTFVIPHPKLPGRFALFEIKGGRYCLNTRDFMEGKISSPQGVQDLATMRGTRSIVLDEKSRGKISIGDTTLLFQFVIAPPVQPRPQLPAALRGGWFKSFTQDWLFWLLNLVALVLHVGPLLYLINVDWPVEETGFDLDNKYLQLVLQMPEEDILEKMKGETKTSEEGEVGEEEQAGEDMAETTDTKKKGPVKQLTDEEKAALEAQRRAKLEAQVSKSGLLAALGSLGEGVDGQAGADLLKAGGVDSDIDQVMKTVSGVKTAGAGDVGGTLRAPAGSEGGGKVADIGAIRVSQADADLSTTGPDEKKVKGSASAGKGDEVGGTGILDSAEVNKVVKSRLTAIKMCYEKALKQNPTLEGKLSVQFTIGTSGRVTSASIKADTLGNPDVASCVLDKVKTFAFSKPEGGSVEYVFPFVFKPSG